MHDDNNSLQLCCPPEGGGSEEGGGVMLKKERTDKNSDARRRHSQRYNSVKGVGCEEQEKTWTGGWGSTPQERQRGRGISPILSRQEWIEQHNDVRSLERIVLQVLGV